MQGQKRVLTAQAQVSLDVRPTTGGWHPEVIVFAFLRARQVGELRRQIEEEQRMLLHFQEQKMALAVQCYDLVDTHVQNLGRNMDGLREELEVRGGRTGRPWCQEAGCDSVICS